MKKFFFPLDKVLDYKEQVLDGLKAEHARILMKVRECERAIEELEQLQLLDDLARLGLGVGELRQMKELMEGSRTEENQLRLLKKWRFQMLDEIHGKQQSLDRLDYVIYKIREKNKIGK